MSRLCEVIIYRTKNETEEKLMLSKSGLLDNIHKLIGAECCDCVNLRDGKVMLVDDTGAIDGKPINTKGTKLYHKLCGGITPNSIHGDVAICFDSDFA